MFKLLKHLCSVNTSFTSSSSKQQTEEIYDSKQQQEQIINKLKISQFQINFKWQIPLKML